MDIQTYLPKIIFTLVSILVILIIRAIARLTVKRFAEKFQRSEHRSRLVVKYFDFLFVCIVLFVNIFVWGVNFKDIGLIFSSVFAIIGVAFFAQWSILSNVTSGIILYFTIPYKIGDTIKIHDKDFVADPLTIIDIKSFQIILRNQNGELFSYPNNLIIQKGVTLVSSSHMHQEYGESEDKNLSQTVD